jgi:4-oxalocrotonate tautomerase
MVEVEGEGMRDLTWVVIEEVKAGDWAIGGKFPNPKPKSA